MRPKTIWIGLAAAGALTLAAVLTSGGCAVIRAPQGAHAPG